LIAPVSRHTKDNQCAWAGSGASNSVDHAECGNTN
jgi:hypothetical protein